MSTKDAGNKPVLPVLKGKIKFFERKAEYISFLPSFLRSLATRAEPETECSRLDVTEGKDRQTRLPLLNLITEPTKSQDVTL